MLFLLLFIIACLQLAAMLFVTTWEQMIAVGIVFLTCIFGLFLIWWNAFQRMRQSQP